MASNKSYFYLVVYFTTEQHTTRIGNLVNKPTKYRPESPAGGISVCVSGCVEVPAERR